MTSKHILSLFCLCSLLFSCEKTDESNYILGNPEPLKRTNAEFPYEVYKPNVSDEAQEFHESTLATFNSDSAEATPPLINPSGLWREA
ncbi:MAG: hypothetical protein ACJAZH_000885 [Roseivirga sp.]|jgi:hypothetical protein